MAVQPSTRSVASEPNLARLPGEKVLARFDTAEQRRLRRLLAAPVEFIDSDLFRKPAVCRAFFADVDVPDISTAPWCNRAEAPSIEDNSTLPVATLTTEQERALFLRLNYARYRMARIVDRFAGKRLTARAATELLWWHTQAVTARCSIVQANVPLVLAMSKRSRLGNMDYAELISEGNMALLRSVDKFDCGRGFKFSTYACRAILKSFSRVAMKTSRYRGRFPTEFDPSLERSDYLDTVRDEQEADCVDELQQILARNTAELNEVEFKVIQARFALGEAANSEAVPKTLEQVGLLIGVTKERVRQIQNRALAKLRTKLQDDFLAA